EPWLVDADPAPELSIDFDGTMSGIVRVPEAALKRHVVPATTPVQPGAPIMKARTKAITGQPLATESAPVEQPYEEPEQPEVELPHADGPLSVGDETLMVRPIPAARGK